MRNVGSYWDLRQKYGEQVGLPKATRRFHARRHARAVPLLEVSAPLSGRVKKEIFSMTSRQKIVYALLVQRST